MNRAPNRQTQPRRYAAASRVSLPAFDDDDDGDDDQDDLQTIVDERSPRWASRKRLPVPVRTPTPMPLVRVSGPKRRDPVPQRWDAPSLHPEGGWELTDPGPATRKRRLWLWMLVTLGFATLVGGVFGLLVALAAGVFG